MDQFDMLKSMFGNFEIIELSHPFEEQMPVWPTHSKFFHTLWSSYEHGETAVTYQLLVNEHNGTHVDAPAHFIKEGEHHTWIDEIQVGNFFAVCRTIDMSFLPQNGEVLEEHIVKWETENGVIEKDEAVLFYFGWSKYWKKKPDEKEYVSDWPGIGKSAAEYLLKREVKLVGVDTLAADSFNSKDMPCHYTLLGNGILIVENLNNLDKMGTKGFFMALPLLIKGGSGSPIRAIGYSTKKLQS